MHESDILARILMKRVKRAIGYVRVSTGTQEQKGQSIVTQQKKIKAFCKLYEIELVDIVTDPALSGAMGYEADDLSKRPGIQEVFKRRDEYDALIAEDSSRLWRDKAANVEIVRFLKKQSVELFCIDQPDYEVDPTDPSKYLMTNFTDIIASYQRLYAIRKMAENRKSVALDGAMPSGSLCFGYERVPDGKKKKAAIVPEQAEIIKTIYRAARLMTVSQIALMLNAPGSKALALRNNKPWTEQYVRKLLKNVFYIGVVMYGGEQAIGRHPPILTPGEFLGGSLGGKHLLHSHIREHMGIM